MLFQALSKIKTQTIISSLILMIVGLLMLILPEQYDGLLVEYLGYSFILFGGVMIWEFIANEKKISSWVFFTVALLLLLIGIIVLISGKDTLVVLSVVFGIFLIIDGVHSFLYAMLYARRSGINWWWILLILCVLLIIAGLNILFNPWWPTAHSLLKVIGGVLLFAAAVGIIRLILVWPIKKA